MKLYAVRDVHDAPVGVFYARDPVDLVDVMDQFTEGPTGQGCSYREAERGATFFVSPHQPDAPPAEETGPLNFFAPLDDSNGFDGNDAWKSVPYIEWLQQVHGDE
jgi:hypothetical protein